MISNTVTTILFEETEPQGKCPAQGGKLVSDKAGIWTQIFSLSTQSTLPTLGQLAEYYKGTSKQDLEWEAG